MSEKHKILIVDDEQSMLITLEDILEILGYEIFTASNGFEAVELVQEEKIDVVLMDFKMPGMNGVDAYRKIVQIDSSVKVIFITAYYDEKIIKEALSHGLGSILHKPLNIPRLLEYINVATANTEV